MAAVSPSDISWGSYDAWEGPRYIGHSPFVLPALPSWNDQVMAVISRCEGLYSSINMYDRAICSVGIVQWIELAQLAVSGMLGQVAEDAPHALQGLRPVMEQSGVTFDRKDRGRWRFRRGAVWMESPDALRWMYLGGSSGRKGAWSEDQKRHARAWAAGLATVFEDPGAQAAQIAYTVPKLQSFVFEPARSVLWDGTEPDNLGLHGCLRAAFLSFACNLPVVAAKQVERLSSTAPKWSEAWAIDFLRQLVLGSQVAIWPGRYNRIRTTLELLFGVDLPDVANDLAADDGLGSTLAIQQALLRLGYDPGPLDDQWGRLVAGAVRAYQRARGLTPDGVVGPRTRAHLRVDLAALG